MIKYYETMPKNHHQKVELCMFIDHRVSQLIRKGICSSVSDAYRWLADYQFCCSSAWVARSHAYLSASERASNVYYESPNQELKILSDD
jgi:hypothetical protein